MNEKSYEVDTGRSAMPVMSGFILGALLGAGIALLLAPAPGNETRRRIGQTARNLGDKARTGFERARGAISDLRDSARSAVEHGRQEYERTRSHVAQENNPNPTGGYTSPRFQESGQRPS